MAGSQIATSVTIISSLLGYQGLSLTGIGTSALTAIAAGSKVEVGGAFFTFASDDTPTAWSAITTAESAYIALTPSGSAGSQILSSSWASATPVYSDSKQGWYTSAASTIRVVASAFKVSNTACGIRTVFRHRTDEEELYFTRASIGGWNMDSVASVTIGIGINAGQVRHAEAWVRGDTTLVGSDVMGLAANMEDISAENAGSVELQDSATGLNVEVKRQASGKFDAVGYDATVGTVVNRGFVNVWYTTPITPL